MTLQQMAPFLSAGAATLAAVLTALNLWLTGRRAHVAWTRSALEHAFVDFLTAHYDHWDACSDVTRLMSGKHTHHTEDQLLERAREADSQMMRCITRFRVLASPTLAKTALELRRFNATDFQAIEEGDLESLVAARATAAHGRKTARDNFVTSSQAVLGIRH